LGALALVPWSGRRRGKRSAYATALFVSPAATYTGSR
jgi:hypothetical protein